MTLTFHPKVIIGFPENLPSAADIPVSTDTLVYFLQLNSELSIADPGQKSFTTSLYNKTSLQNLYFE